MSYVNTSKVSIRKINGEIAKRMVVKHHYSHSLNKYSFALGIYYDTETENQFFAGKNEDLIGCIVYGDPVGSNVIRGISNLLNNGEVLELMRLFIYDFPNSKNIESYCIAQSFHWIRKNMPHIKVIVSYADPVQKHLGKIYQATNWLYQGCSPTWSTPNYRIRIDPEGKWIHSRTVCSRYGSQNIDILKKAIGKTFYRKLDPNKHRYLYVLTNDKRERKKLIGSIKQPILPYPKEIDPLIDKIETIEV